VNKVFVFVLVLLLLPFVSAGMLDFLVSQKVFMIPFYPKEAEFDSILVDDINAVSITAETYFGDGGNLTGIPQNLDGGFASCIYLVSQGYDGGFSNSVYYSSQRVDGGGA